MQDPDQWREKGVHWHAYIEPRDGSEMQPGGRACRLRRVPDAVIRTPEEVADWIAGMTRKHAQRQQIRLIGPRGGVGHVGDEGHIEHDMGGDLDAACRGNSVYADFPRDNDRLHLWVEAVTADDCPGVHERQETE